MKEKLVLIVDIAKQQGRHPSDVTESLKALNFQVIKTRGNGNRPSGAVTESDAEKYFKVWNYETPNAKPTVVSHQHEDQLKTKREEEGWFVIPTYKAGTPDLICLRSAANGLFEVLLEEIKGPGDKLSKEQYEKHEDYKARKIPSLITWL